MWRSGFGMMGKGCVPAGQLVATLCICTVLATGCTRRSSQQQVQQVEMQVFDLLNKDCGTGDPESLGVVVQLQGLGAPAIEVLYGALRRGPSVSVRDTLTSHAESEYTTIQASLVGFAGVNPPGFVDSLEAASESEYVTMQVESYVLGVHQRALNALVALNPATLEDSLNAIKLEPTLPAFIVMRIDEEIANIP